MALLDGKLDPIDLMAIDYCERQGRQEKLDYIVKAVQESGDSTFDITPLCYNLKIKLTPEEFNWIVEQTQED